MTEERKDTITYNGEPIMKTIDRCCSVIEKWGEAGKFTEKGKDIHGFEILSDFAEALGLDINLYPSFTNQSSDEEDSWKNRDGEDYFISTDSW